VRESGEHRATLHAAPHSPERSEAQRLADLERERAEWTERQQITELEITALRHELELRMAYNSHLEAMIAAHRERIDFLEAHLGQVTDAFSAEVAAERARADAESEARRRLSDELLAERARLSYRLVARLLVWFGHASARS
jgi:predicted  nucleic acid-binding Zn-ribbon protein